MHKADALKADALKLVHKNLRLGGYEAPAIVPLIKGTIFIETVSQTAFLGTYDRATICSLRRSA